jgi:hypothetical protein
VDGAQDVHGLYAPGYGEKDQAVAKMTKRVRDAGEGPGARDHVLTAEPLQPDPRHDEAGRLEQRRHYITSPDKAPPPQPDQMKVQELQIKDKLADAAVANSQANNMKVQKTLVIDSQRMDNERHQMQHGRSWTSTVHTTVRTSRQPRVSTPPRKN